MYRLLLATDKPETKTLYDTMEWNAMGFKQPRTAGHVEEALQILQKHHLDAVVFDLPENEQNALISAMMKEYPSIPVVRAGHDQQDASGLIREVSGLLNRMSEDFSDDGFTKEDKLMQCRHEFFRELLGGNVKNREDIADRLMMLRSRMDPTRPCAVAALSLPDGDNFLSDRWRYGHERLEVALRNFLGIELEGLRILVSVLPDEEIYLLACPMRGQDVDVRQVEPDLQKHTADSLTHIREYLGLSLIVNQITILPSILDLAVAG